jgi:hypothetical protein
MKKPVLGSNSTQSYIDFETTSGKIRFGKEGSRMFIEYGETKAYLSDSTGVKLFDGIDITSGKITRTTPLGSTPVDTVSIKEYGDGRNMVTELTLTDFIVGALAGAGAALGVGNIVYTFPAAGAHLETVYYQELSLKCAGTPVNTDTGLGSVIATGAVSVLSGTATFEDRLTGQTIPTAAGGGSATKKLAVATAGALTGIAVNESASIKNVFLNSAGTWNANNSGNLTATGIIVLKWTKMN